MHGNVRDHYLSIANGAGEPEPEGHDWSENYPLDLPDWDWPDAPRPDVNDRNFAWGWLAVSTLISIGSLIYLASQVW